MIPVNPEAIGLFGLFATVICFGLEQLGVGVKGADHEKLTRTASIWALSSASSACSGFWWASFSSKAATRKPWPTSSCAA